MKGNKGFTLIELLLVVMIIGFMLAVILPRGLRATTDAKYNLVRQNAAELAAYGNDWVEQGILAQDEDSNATRREYLETLVTQIAKGDDSSWVASSWVSNWNKSALSQISITNRRMNNNNNQYPEMTVEEIIDPAKVLRNPFNGAGIFLPTSNYSATNVIPGAIACVRAQDTSTGGAFDYYAFIFQGTDSTSADFDPDNADFHAGMEAGASLKGAREGVFFTKVRK